MSKATPLLALLLLLLVASSQRVGVPPCPLVYSIGSVISGTSGITQPALPSPSKRELYLWLEAKMYNVITTHLPTPLRGFQKSRSVRQQ